MLTFSGSGINGEDQRDIQMGTPLFYNRCCTTGFIHRITGKVKAANVAAFRRLRFKVMANDANATERNVDTG